MGNKHCFEILNYLYSKGLLLGTYKEDDFNKLKKEIQHGILVKSMEEAGKMFCKTIPMIIEPKTATYWIH